MTFHTTTAESRFNQSLEAEALLADTVGLGELSPLCGFKVCPTLQTISDQHREARQQVAHYTMLATQHEDSLANRSILTEDHLALQAGLLDQVEAGTLSPEIAELRLDGMRSSERDDTAMRTNQRLEGIHLDLGAHQAEVSRLEGVYALLCPGRRSSSLAKFGSAVRRFIPSQVEIAAKDTCDSSQVDVSIRR